MLYNVGDRNCGKSSLLSRMQHEDSDVNKGVALTYSFVDVYESENEDPTGRIDFWQLEGEVAHKELLQFGLQEKTVANALVVIALDLSQPWTMVEALKRWLGVLQTHLEGVYANLEVEGPLSKTALQEKLRASFQTYREPSSSEATTAKKKKTHSSHAVDVSVWGTSLSGPDLIFFFADSSPCREKCTFKQSWCSDNRCLL